MNNRIDRNEELERPGRRMGNGNFLTRWEEISK